MFFSYRYTPFRLAQLGAPPRPEPDLKQRGQLRRGHRARQVEALAAVGLGGAQVLELPGRLDPLGDDLEAELAGRRSIAAMNAPPRSSSGTPAGTSGRA